MFFLTNILKFYDTSLLNILFGNFQISPLQNGVCHALSYMTEKVSFDGENIFALAGLLILRRLDYLLILVLFLDC